MTTNDYKRIGAQIREERRAVWKLLGEPERERKLKGRQLGFSALYMRAIAMTAMFPDKYHPLWEPWQDFSAEKRRRPFMKYLKQVQEWLEQQPNPPTPAAQAPSR